MNITQFKITLTPCEWVFIPKIGRVKPDFITNDNFTYFRFLFLYIQIFHPLPPSSLDSK